MCNANVEKVFILVGQWETEDGSRYVGGDQHYISALIYET